VPPNHVSRVVSDAIDRMNLAPVLKRFKPGGTSSYHPRMMLKVLVYAFSQRRFSSRDIEKSLAENIYFMWLAGGNRPDHNTINRFRSVTLKGIIGEVFAAVLELLVEEKYVKLEDFFLDGTKVEANANKFSYAWGKSIKRYSKQIREKVHQLLAEVEQLNCNEDEQFGDADLLGIAEKPLDSAKLEETINNLNERLAGKKQDRRTKTILRHLKDKFLPKIKDYEGQEAILEDRNSFSKTDPGATFMRLKDDHMNTGHLKPAYNVQIATEDQFILNYFVNQNANDSVALIPTLNTYNQLTGRLPKHVTADAGYGSEENYEYLAALGINAYVKHQEFYRESKPAFRDNPFRPANMPYDKDNNEFTCPAGRKLKYKESKTETTINGHQIERCVYVSEGCEGCTLRDKCTKGQGDKNISMSFRCWELRAKASELLRSEEGEKQRSRRGHDVESVFGHIKHNLGFRRFKLRTLDKVNVEWGLLCIAHNLQKKAYILQDRARQ